MALILLADGTKSTAIDIGARLRVKSNTFDEHCFKVGTKVVYTDTSLFGDAYAIVADFNHHPPIYQSVQWCDLEVYND